MKPVYLDAVLYKYIKNIEQFDTLHDFYKSIKNKDLVKEIEMALIELSENKILITDKEVDKKTIELIRDSIPPPYIQIVYFILTEDCNFNCKYCFIKRENQNTNKKGMSVDRGLQGLDFFTKQIRSNQKLFDSKKSIIFYGGEPLLKFEVLKEIVLRIKKYQCCKKLPENIDLSLVTNGSLITKEIASFLKENNINVGVSIDGDEFTTNTNRLFNNSMGTYNHIRKGIEICKNEGLNIGLSVTLSETSMQFPKRVMEALKNDYNMDSLSFNMLLTDKNYPVSNDYFHSVSKFIIEAFKVFRKNHVYEDRIMRKVKAFFKAEIYPYDCGATGGRQVVIAPDGQVGICHGFLNNRKYFVTNVESNDFDPQKSKTYKEWNKRSPINMSQCQDCFALGICGGGCPMNSYRNFGSIWETDIRFCTHAKMTLEWLIWDLFDNMQKNKNKS